MKLSLLNRTLIARWRKRNTGPWFFGLTFDRMPSEHSPRGYYTLRVHCLWATLCLCLWPVILD
jgi:hypothetical protein